MPFGSVSPLSTFGDPGADFVEIILPRPRKPRARVFSPFLVLDRGPFVASFSPCRGWEFLVLGVGGPPRGSL